MTVQEFKNLKAGDAVYRILGASRALALGVVVDINKAHGTVKLEGPAWSYNNYSYTQLYITYSQAIKDLK